MAIKRAVNLSNWVEAFSRNLSSTFSPHPLRSLCGADRGSRIASRDSVDFARRRDALGGGGREGYVERREFSRERPEIGRIGIDRSRRHFQRYHIGIALSATWIGKAST